MLCASRVALPFGFVCADACRQGVAAGERNKSRMEGVDFPLKDKVKLKCEGQTM